MMESVANNVISFDCQVYNLMIKNQYNLLFYNVNNYFFRLFSIFGYSISMQDLIFVALDLETTGLDTKHDTIIEIAVVKFTLTLHEDTFEVHLLDERSMLVHPGIDISQEVEMITGITNEMLVGRTQWSDIREKVRDFIGDAAIV